jgi:RNA polymerase sigma factor (sigma-70 family)
MSRPKLLVCHTTHRPDRRDGANAVGVCVRLRPVGPDASDAELVAQLRLGQHSAFDTLADRYHARLLHYCWQILRSREDAEDALQDVLASAFSALIADEREIELRPWLYRIARNRCINELRRAKAVAVESMDEHWADNGRTAAETAGGRLDFRELVRGIQSLPDTQRTALLLREVDGFAYRQIAAALNTTVPAVKSLLVRARAGLLDAAVYGAMCDDDARDRRVGNNKGAWRSHPSPRAVYREARATAQAAA